MKIVFYILCALTSQAWAGDPICAKTSFSLHKGPGTQFPVTWKVGKFTPFLRVDSKNGWAKVTDMDGEVHWAPARDLTNSYRCSAVKSQVATLRQAPLAAAPTTDLKTLDRYTPLKRLETDGDWVQVEDEFGHKAWINSSNLWTPMKIQSINF